MNESIENISVETDSDTINVKPSEDGKVTVEAQPKEIEADTLGPVSPETQAEIEADEEEPEEETKEEVVEETVEEPETSIEEDEGEIEVTDFDEDQFNELGESYLKEVYGNVTSFKTTKGYIDGDRIKLEGLINFNSGKQAKTSFIFESFNVSKRGKYKFIGENIQETNDYDYPNNMELIKALNQISMYLGSYLSASEDLVKNIAIKNDNVGKKPLALSSIIYVSINYLNFFQSR